ncbi:MAG: GNAT family N-acetyltransferase [Flavobacterium sp. BFFFF1]|uniref:GNAT family N-acetyltransferase n=1 Tax=Flavobacterium sp. BFFFF1 TaxID=2015557 RepID=UPI000BCE3A5B|nr:GNAT family N-acetyltransferase [Flavobacterium sp. BFFFF1]OYU80165.1 MAG: GNAT family N-acetyltransferase [Flavobacterium sp. BFFFF1]
MKNYTVTRFKNADSNAWNDFLPTARNATFLFDRRFMDYHSDRFSDFSIMVFESGQLVALMPANRKADVFYSHQGLTYGGLVYSTLKLADVIAVFQQILKFLHHEGITKLVYKTLPEIYSEKPSQEMEYAIFLAKADHTRRDVLAVLDLSLKNDLSEVRKRGIKKGEKNQLAIVEDGDFATFWDKILIPNLESRHQASPVHTVEEIELLASRFPKNIRQFNVYHNDEIVAGTTIFVTPHVAHAQYIAANETRSGLGSLDFLFNELIQKVFREKRYFDFGISNEEQGTKLNAGLSYWKESFGASAVVQDFYEIPTGNYRLLDNAII